MPEISPSDVSFLLFSTLNALGITHTTLNHPAVFTVAESQNLRGRVPGAHTKNLFVKDKKGNLFLITALEDASIDLKRLHEAIGAQGRVSFASAEQLQAHLGVAPGSVTPFAAMNDRQGQVSVILQDTLMAQPVLQCHPLINTRTTSIASADLVRFLTAVDHPPKIIALPGRTH